MGLSIQKNQKGDLILQANKDIKLWLFINILIWKSTDHKKSKKYKRSQTFHQETKKVA
jgi:hypothetical protein